MDFIKLTECMLYVFDVLGQTPHVVGINAATGTTLAVSDAESQTITEGSRIKAYDTITIALTLDSKYENGKVFLGEKELTLTDGSVTYEIEPGDKTDIRSTCTPKSYAITYKDGNDSISGLSPVSYTYGIGATLPVDCEKEGYTFDGWYAASDFSGEAQTAIANTEYGDKTFYAKFTEIEQGESA